ncbi:MAG TPA: hypothetical protein VH815_03855, partial [Acidobacteriota bacterium]
ECQIDSIAQSWAILSEAGNSQRATQSIESAYKRLVKQDPKLVLLFQPAFAKSDIDPGYVKLYPPGIRENGGHYTHAATWLVAAFAELGKGNRAFELFQYLSPIEHSLDEKNSYNYKVEPYAVSADIYSCPERLGMGGWSWYTGSAGWLYRTAIEWILGFRLNGDHFVLQPCIPSSWKSFQLLYRCGTSSYKIQVENPNGKISGVSYLELNGTRLDGNQIPLDKTEKEYNVKVMM